MARRTYSGVSSANSVESPKPLTDDYVDNDVNDNAVKTEGDIPDGWSVAGTPKNTEQQAESVNSEPVSEAMRPGAIRPWENSENQGSENQNEAGSEEAKEESIYSELADKYGLSLGEMEVVADYLKFVENKNDRMKAYQTFMFAGVLVALFSLIAEVLLIARKLPPAFVSWRIGVILAAVIAISILVVVFSFKKFMAYSRMEAFKSIEYIIPITLMEKKKDTNTNKEKWCVKADNSNEAYWYDWNYSYTSKTEVNGKPYKIKVNTRLKPGLTGYVVGYENRFGQTKEDFIVFA